MRRVPSIRAAAVLLTVGTGGGCVLVSDLDHEVAGDGRAAAQGSSSSGAEGGADPSTSATTSASTASGDGGRGGEGGAPATSTGPGGGPGVGGAGGGGGAACTFEGEGRGDGPWSLTLGPVPESGPGLAHDVDRAGERVVLGLVAKRQELDPRPVLLGDQELTSGTEDRYVVGWVDDVGVSRGWALETAAPVIDAAGIGIEPVGAGVALVTLTGAAVEGGSMSGTLVVPVDLCDGSELEPIVRCNAQVSAVTIDAAEDGTMVLALTVSTGATCSALPGDCVLPAIVGAQDTVLMHVDPGGSCASTLVREDDEGLSGSYPYSSQNGVVPSIADDGSVIAVGVYDGDLFEGAHAISTGLPHYLEGDRPGSLDTFHRFLARFEVDGGQLRVDDAVDLGIIAFAVGGHGVEWRDGAAVVVAGANIASQPTGPFDAPVTVTGAGYLDVLAGVFPTPGAPTALRWYGGGSVDVPWRLSSTDAGMMIAGWSTSVDATTIGACDDPVVVVAGSLRGGGCAFFVPLQEEAELGVPSVVGAIEAGALDVGYGAYALPGGDTILVGATTGTVQLDRTLAPPPDGFVQLYVARR